MPDPVERLATLEDVAKRAGYSRSTASLVFRGSPLVAENTRRRVQDAANELGYVYNRRAASLRMQRSNTIGLLVPGLSNPFFSDLTEAIEEALVPSGYTMLLGNTLDNPERQQTLIRTLVEYRVDGLLIIPANGSSPELAAPLEGLRTPHVLMTRRGRSVRGPYVGSNDRHAGQLAAEHLASHGCGTIAYFGGPENADARIERQEGVLEACAALGMRFDPSWAVRSQTSSSGGHQVAAELLIDSSPPDGIVFHSDAVAFGAMRALEDAGVKVGLDVRVVGFDDVEHARHWSPALTTVAVNARRIGRSAVRLLLESIADRRLPTETVVFEPELRVRQSCGEHEPSSV